MDPRQTGFVVPQLKYYAVGHLLSVAKSLNKSLYSVYIVHVPT